MSSRRIGIFFATATGLAELCAEEIEAALRSHGFPAEARPMDRLGLDDLAPYAIAIIVSSTHGHGDIPDNGRGFFAAVGEAGDLKHIGYLVFGLGDRTYADTFCSAGEQWDALFAAKGAIRLAPFERHDSSDGTLAEDVASTWVRQWIHRLSRAA